MPAIGRFDVSALGYGGMSLSSIYGRAEDEASVATLHRAADVGITFFDTATGYGAGHNEAPFGRALRDRRSGLVIASKFTHGQAGEGKSKVSAADAVDASLTRLGLDHLRR